MQKGISRIKSKSTRGWFVRAYKGGTTYSKLFSDKKWGSEEGAFEAAVRYRDELIQQLEQMPKKPRKRRVVTRDARNKTGVIGITRCKRKNSQGQEVDSYSVSWRPAPGVQKCTSFSIRKYGEEKAFKLAVQHRFTELKQAYGEEAARFWLEQIPDFVFQKYPWKIS